jgi:hypothetical protein
MILFQKILCRSNPEYVFFIKTCVGGITCLECSNWTLFHRKFSMDIVHPLFGDIVVTSRIYEYVPMNPSSSLGVAYMRVEFL